MKEIKELNVDNFTNFEELIQKIIEIHEQLFPNATLNSQLDKFQEEFEETKEAIGKQEQYKEEIADMFIVGCGIKRYNRAVGLAIIKSILDDFETTEQLYDLAKQIINKMNKNINRKWDNKNGLYKHISIVN